MANEVTQPAYEEAEVAKQFCRGQGNRFKGIPCEHYDTAAMQCRLLREHKRMRPVLDYGRCLSIDFFGKKMDGIIKMIEKKGPEAVLRLVYGQKSAYKRYRKLREQRAAEPSKLPQEAEARTEAPNYRDFISIDLPKFLNYYTAGKLPESKGLLDAEVENPYLPSMYSLINKAICFELLGLLRKAGFIDQKNECGAVSICLPPTPAPAFSLRYGTRRPARSRQMSSTKKFGNLTMRPVRGMPPKGLSSSRMRGRTRSLKKRNDSNAVMERFLRPKNKSSWKHGLALGTSRTN